MKTELQEIRIQNIPDGIELPEGAHIWKQGKYMIIHGAFGHPIAGARGRIPYHRFILFESLGRPQSSACKWCGYVLPWKSTVSGYQWSVVNADHLDADTSNNDPTNLAPSCCWCNANRSWAEKHADFWLNWRHWLADVPPVYRPNLISIAKDFGINSSFTDNGHATDI